MITVAPLSAPDHALEKPDAELWRRCLLRVGAPLCLAGLVANHLGARWHGGRFAELIVLSLLALAGAGILRRLSGWRLASGLALAWLLALAFDAGVGPALATALFGLASLSLGGLLARDAPIALRIACGGRSISEYDRPVQAAARAAEAQVDGCAWMALLRREHITDVLGDPANATSAQRAFVQLRAMRRQAEGDVAWWHTPAEPVR